jgi:hypothetical protein
VSNTEHQIYALTRDFTKLVQVRKSPGPGLQPAGRGFESGVADGAVGGIEAVDDLFLEAGHEVPVGVDRDGDAGVSEAFHHRPAMDALGDQKGRVSVSLMRNSA